MEKVSNQPKVNQNMKEKDLNVFEEMAFNKPKI